jgi:putative FmdB family regulatory protein
MPIKSFTCTACGEKFERILLSRSEFEAATSSVCPECGSSSPADEVPLVARRNPAYGLQT